MSPVTSLPRKEGRGIAVCFSSSCNSTSAKMRPWFSPLNSSTSNVWCSKGMIYLYLSIMPGRHNWSISFAADRGISCSHSNRDIPSGEDEPLTVIYALSSRRRIRTVLLSSRHKYPWMMCVQLWAKGLKFPETRNFRSVSVCLSAIYRIYDQEDDGDNNQAYEYGIDDVVCLMLLFDFVLLLSSLALLTHNKYIKGYTVCLYFSPPNSIRYALMNPSIFPSITPFTSLVWYPVRWSFTLLSSKT